MPPLDTRKWGEWMAKRAQKGDDGFHYSASSRLGALNDTLDESDGEEDATQDVIEFDHEGLEMAKVSYGDDAELEYGEGDELEDQSHDSRLFDAEDGGKGINEEANKFFNSKQTSKGRCKNKKRMEKRIGGNSHDSGTDTKDAASNHPQIPANDDTEHNHEHDIADGSFFDALQPPSGENNAATLGFNHPDNKNSSSAAQEFAQNPHVAVEDLLGNGYVSYAAAAETNEHVSDDNNNTHLDLQSSMVDLRSSLLVAAEDKGYDEETDLLGLRSDSPPPLDLEEIEKNLMENMQLAKL